MSLEHDVREAPTPAPATVAAEHALGSGATIDAVLREGTAVQIRRLRPSDAPGLASAFEHLSAESRRLRFISPKDRLSSRELRYLTDVDGHDHEALVAFDPVTRDGVAVARFVRLEDEPHVAEVAVTVTDDWQQRGLGTLLLELLAARARAEDLTHFSALVSSDNTVMIDVLRRAGGEIEPLASGAGVVEYRTALGEAGLREDLSEALRSAADGRLHLPQRLTRLLSALLAAALPGHHPPSR